MQIMNTFSIYNENFSTCGLCKHGESEHLIKYLRLFIIKSLVQLQDVVHNSSRSAYLKSFLFGYAPKMIKMVNFVVNTIENNHRKETIVQCFIKRFEQTFTITVFQFSLVNVLCPLIHEEAWI